MRKRPQLKGEATYMDRERSELAPFVAFGELDGEKNVSSFTLTVSLPLLISLAVFEAIIL